METIRPHLERVAAVVVGTSRVRTLIAERGAGGRFGTLTERSRWTGSGRGLAATGVIHDVAVTATIGALGEQLALIRDSGASRRTVVATGWLPRARNASAVLSRVRAELALELELLAEADENRLTYLAASGSLPASPDSVAVCHVGGGGTALVVGRGKDILHQTVLDAGALHLTERFLRTDPITTDEYRALLEHLIRGPLDALAVAPAAGLLVGVGGAVQSLAALKRGQEDTGRSSAIRLKRGDIEELLSWLLGQPAAERRAAAGLEAGQSDTLVAGASIVLALQKCLRHDELVVSDRDLRHGLIEERFR